MNKQVKVKKQDKTEELLTVNYETIQELETKLAFFEELGWEVQVEAKIEDVEEKDLEEVFNSLNTEDEEKEEPNPVVEKVQETFEKVKEADITKSFVEVGKDIKETTKEIDFSPIAKATKKTVKSGLGKLQKLTEKAMNKLDK